MALTAKKRIPISVPSDIESILQQLSKRDAVPVATKARELLLKALEIEEDIALDTLAQRRDTKKATYLSHEQAWR